MIDERIDLIASELSKRPYVRRAWLFGSRARGDNAPGSDVDIEVDINPEFSLEYLSLSDELTRAAGVKVDVIADSDSMHPSIRDGIERDRILIHGS